MDATTVKIVKSYIKTYADMADGTRYESINVDSTTRGLKFDQIILIDDNKWKIFNKYRQIIDELTNFCLTDLFNGLSVQIIKYEW